MVVSGSAVQQPPGGGGIVGGQHDQAGLLPGERADLAGGLGELTVVADAGQLAALQDVGAVGEVPGQQ
jgi:hypothetical protein